jgi:hypothetical protein
MAGASDAEGSGHGGADIGGPVSRQAADDVAQVIRGKHWLRRVVEMAESAAVADQIDRDATDAWKAS